MSTLEKGPDPDQAAAEAAIFLEDDGSAEPAAPQPGIEDMVAVGRISLIAAKDSFEGMKQYADVRSAYGEESLLADPKDGAIQIFAHQDSVDARHEQVAQEVHERLDEIYSQQDSTS